MYIHYQRTENERLAHNQVNIPTIAVGAHEQKTEGLLPLSLAPDSRHDHFQPDYSNYNTNTHALDQLVRKHFITIIITRHLRCVVSPPIIITKCTHGKHGNYDLTIMIL